MKSKRAGQEGGEDTESARQSRQAGSDGEGEERMTVHHFDSGGTVSGTFILVDCTNELHKTNAAA